MDDWKVLVLMSSIYLAQVTSIPYFWGMVIGALAVYSYIYKD